MLVLKQARGYTFLWQELNILTKRLKKHYSMPKNMGGLLRKVAKAATAGEKCIAPATINVVMEYSALKASGQHQ